MTDARFSATALAVAVAAALCAAASPVRAGDAPGATRSFSSISGTLRAVSPDARRVTIVGPEGAVTLDFDRNTSVWLDTRLGTLRDLVTGAEVRAQYGRDGRAAWIEVRRATRPPALSGGGVGGAGPAAPGPPAPERAAPGTGAPVGGGAPGR
jgi:hypothetical protein